MRPDKTVVRRTMVTTLVKIEFPASEVEHIIRCWIEHNMSDGLRPPPNNMNDIALNAVVNDECQLIGYEAVYQPKSE